MNHYEPSIPRAAFGMAALAMTILTAGLTVFVPAKLDAGDRLGGRLAASQPAAAVIEVAIIPARVDVVGVREQELVSAQVRNVDPRCKQQEI